MTSDPGSPAEQSGPAGDPPLTFPDLPRLELDQLLMQLTERAGEVLAAQGRLRGLLRANQAIIGDLALPVVLRRIAEAARDLVGARYAALGVLAPDGHLAEFVHVGMPDDMVAAIGDLPQGKGLLGAPIDDPKPIRIASIPGDPRSSGFPPGRPPMRSFLGVPVRIRGKVFGNLYLSESNRGRFTFEDEELTKALAATAAVAIDNARHYEATRRRGEWLAATAAITRGMLAPAGSAASRDGSLEVVAERARLLAEADLVLLARPVPGDPDSLRISVVAGPLSDRFAGMSVPSESIAGHVFRTGEAVRLDHPDEHPDVSPPTSERQFDAGPLLAVPLTDSQRPRGVLMVLRAAGRPLFSEEDMAMATGFANQASLALELAEARAEQERLDLLDERERIAGDLHDHVVQRLFAAGLAVQSVASSLPPGRDADRLADVIDEVDGAIAQIRTSVFALHRVAPRGRGAGLRDGVLDIVARSTDVLGFAPDLRFDGVVDAAALSLGPEAVDDLLAVLREALSNTARHADAGRVQVGLRVADGVLTLEVRDDGVGIGEVERRSGLANMRSRAERHGGTCTVGAVSPSGTRVSWAIPVR